MCCCYGPVNECWLELYCFRPVSLSVCMFVCPSECLSVCLSVRCCGHSNLVILIRFLLKFHIWISSIKLSFKFEYGFCSTNNNQDCQQYGRRHQCLVLWSLLLSHVCRISSKIHIWIAFIQLLAKMATKMAFTCQFALVNTLT